MGTIKNEVTEPTVAVLVSLVTALLETCNKADTNLSEIPDHFACERYDSRTGAPVTLFATLTHALHELAPGMWDHYTETGEWDTDFLLH